MLTRCLLAQLGVPLLFLLGEGEDSLVVLEDVNTFLVEAANLEVDPIHIQLPIFHPILGLMKCLQVLGGLVPAKGSCGIVLIQP